MSAFKGQLTPLVALYIVEVLFLIAIVAASFLPRDVRDVNNNSETPTERMSMRSTLTQLFDLFGSNFLLKQQFVSFIIFVSIFQGFFNVSRVSLPTYELHLSDHFVGLLQIISSTSALIGAVFFYFLNKRKYDLGKLLCTLFAFISLAAMIFMTLTKSVFPSYALYFVYMFLFELLFFKYQSDVVSACPKEKMPLIATFQYAAAYVGMMIVILIGGVITQHLGLHWAAASCALFYLAVMIKDWATTYGIKQNSGQSTVFWR